MISLDNIQVLVADTLHHFTHITTSEAHSIHARSYMIFYTEQKFYNQMFYKLMQIDGATHNTERQDSYS